MQWRHHHEKMSNGVVTMQEIEGMQWRHQVHTQERKREREVRPNTVTLNGKGSANIETSTGMHQSQFEGYVYV